MKKSSHLSKGEVKRGLLSVTIIFSFLLVFDLSISSCASKSSPSGGDRDTLAPQLDTSYPANKSLHFSADRIILEFDEYLNLKSPQQQINISPLLGEDLEVISRGKKVEILLKDSLRPNTTYIISFGKSLADLNEGNENKNFKYVFSTGSFLDSLHISGTLREAYTAKPVENYLVALYAIDKVADRDSFLLKERPDYYAITNETGSFGMSYLGEGEYLMVAFEDKGGTFKISRLSQPMAFWTDTILLAPDSLYNFDLMLFEPEARLKYLGARQKSAQRIQFAFNRRADSFNVESLIDRSDSAFMMWSENHDTLNYHFTFKADSIQFRLNYDSLFVDSVVTVRLREMDPPRMVMKVVNSKLRSRDTLILRSPVQITKTFSDSIFKFTENDTSNVSFVADSTDPFQWYLLPPQKKPFTLRLKPGALKRGKRRLEDSVDFRIEVLKGEDLGTLYFTVKTDLPEPMIVQLFDEKEELVIQRPFRDSLQLDFKNVIPAKMSVYLIIDADSNERYTPGDFLLYRQPEKRIKYQEELEIRPNWELDLEWFYRSQKAINTAPLLNNDSTAQEE